MMLKFCCFMAIIITVSCQVSPSIKDAKCNVNVLDSLKCAEEPGSCDLEEKWKFCQRYCGICEADETARETSTVANAVATNVSDCKDIGTPLLCMVTKEQGNCYKPVAQAQCAKTCGWCGPNASSPNPTTTTTQPTKVTKTISSSPTTSALSTSTVTSVPPNTKPSDQPPTTKSLKTSTRPTKPELPSTSPTTQQPTILDSTNSSLNATDNNTDSITTTQEMSTTSDNINVSVHQKTSTPKTKVTQQPTSELTRFVPDASTPSSNRKTTPSTISSPKWKSAVTVNVAEDGSLRIKLVLSGFIKNEPLDEITSEVQKLLNKFGITGVQKEDVEDGKTKSGEAVTILTLKGNVPNGKDAKDVKDQLDNDPSFANTIHEKVREVDAGSGLYDGEVDLDTPTSTSKMPKSWAESNWYVIFAIGLAALIIIGLIILAVTTADSRRRQKLQVQTDPEKLAYTKV